MGFRIMKMAREMGVNHSEIFLQKKNEERGTILLNKSVQIASAMGYQLAYAIVPLDGGTLEQMADRRMWNWLLE